MFNIKKLKELKRKLEKEKNLSKVWSFYMDNFSDHAEFTDLGQPTSHSLLEKIVPVISKQIMGIIP